VEACYTLEAGNRQALPGISDYFDGLDAKCLDHLDVCNGLANRPVDILEMSLRPTVANVLDDLLESRPIDDLAVDLEGAVPPAEATSAQSCSDVDDLDVDLLLLGCVVPTWTKT
jgi:hypothetical protein